MSLLYGSQRGLRRIACHYEVGNGGLKFMKLSSLLGQSDTCQRKSGFQALKAYVLFIEIILSSSKDAL